MEAGEGQDSLSVERHPGRRSPKSDGAGEIKKSALYAIVSDTD